MKKDTDGMESLWKLHNQPIIYGGTNQQVCLVLR